MSLGNNFPIFFRCYAPIDQKDADIGLAAPLEYHLLDIHPVTLSEVIFGRHAEYPQDSSPVHAEPRRTSKIRERRIVNARDVERHAGQFTVSDGHRRSNWLCPKFEDANAALIVGSVYLCRR
jgi:hypothetical protein